MVLNDFGGMVREEWLKSAEIRDEMQSGEYVIMPNHVHAIVLLRGRRGTARRAPPNGRTFGKPVPGCLATIVRAFKSAVTKRINEFRNTAGVPVWQRNYYEHIIRDQADYLRIAEYVADNPRRWAEDPLNPAVFDAAANSATINDVKAPDDVPAAAGLGTTRGIGTTDGVGARRAVPLRGPRGGGGE